MTSLIDRSRTPGSFMDAQPLAAGERRLRGGFQLPDSPPAARRFFRTNTAVARRGADFAAGRSAAAFVAPFELVLKGHRDFRAAACAMRFFLELVCCWRLVLSGELWSRLLAAACARRLDVSALPIAPCAAIPIIRLPSSPLLLEIYPTHLRAAKSTQIWRRSVALENTIGQTPLIMARIVDIMATQDIIRHSSKCPL
jgi:hypothetical protein